MALRATIFKVALIVSDLERGHYATHALTIARHPSETDERMMVRVLAFALAASDALTFGPGLSDADEPDLVERDLSGAITLWIEVGLPDARSLGRALGRAARVLVVAFGRDVSTWWHEVCAALPRAGLLEVLALDAEDPARLARLVERSMHLSCTIQEGNVWFGSDASQLHLVLRRLAPFDH